MPTLFLKGGCRCSIHGSKQPFYKGPRECRINSSEQSPHKRYDWCSFHLFNKSSYVRTISAHTSNLGGGFSKEVLFCPQICHDFRMDGSSIQQDHDRIHPVHGMALLFWWFLTCCCLSDESFVMKNGLLLTWNHKNSLFFWRRKFNPYLHCWKLSF